MGQLRTSTAGRWSARSGGAAVGGRWTGPWTAVPCRPGSCAARSSWWSGRRHTRGFRPSSLNAHADPSDLVLDAVPPATHASGPHRPGDWRGWARDVRPEMGGPVGGVRTWPGWAMVRPVPVGHHVQHAQGARTRVRSAIARDLGAAASTSRQCGRTSPAGGGVVDVCPHPGQAGGHPPGGLGSPSGPSRWTKWYSVVSDGSCSRRMPPVRS